MRTAADKNNATTKRIPVHRGLPARIVRTMSCSPIFGKYSSTVSPAKWPPELAGNWADAVQGPCLSIIANYRCVATVWQVEAFSRAAGRLGLYIFHDAQAGRWIDPPWAKCPEAEYRQSISAPLACHLR